MLASSCKRTLQTRSLQTSWFKHGQLPNAFCLRCWCWETTATQSNQAQTGTMNKTYGFPTGSALQESIFNAPIRILTSNVFPDLGRLYLIVDFLLDYHLSLRNYIFCAVSAWNCPNLIRILRYQACDSCLFDFKFGSRLLLLTSNLLAA